MPVRIYDIAKKLGIESKEVLAKARALGITAAKVPSSSLDKITAEYLENELGGVRPPPIAPTPPGPVTLVVAPTPPALVPPPVELAPPTPILTPAPTVPPPVSVVEVVTIPPAPPPGVEPVLTEAVTEVPIVQAEVPTDLPP